MCGYSLEVPQRGTSNEYPQHVFVEKYEGVSINNQPIPFPMDQDGHDFHALFQYVLYKGTKLHMYRVIL